MQGWRTQRCCQLSPTISGPTLLEFLLLVRKFGLSTKWPKYQKCAKEKFNLYVSNFTLFKEQKKADEIR
jgi:hypothetical protein